MCTIHPNVKKAILELAIEMDLQQIGRTKLKAIQLHSPEYYYPFEKLYQQNKDTFEQALLEMRSCSDSIYNECSNEIREIRYYCPERIVIHILRLSIYFNVAENDIPLILKALFVKSFQGQESRNFEELHTSYLLARACFDFLEWMAKREDQNFRMTYTPRNISVSFSNFITLPEIINVHFASLYEACSRYKYVRKCPNYIRSALNAAFIYDRLTGPIAWETYLSNRSVKSIHRDISILRSVGFLLVPNLIETLLSDIEQKAFQPKEKRMRFCQQTANKTQEAIKNCMETERDIINRFLCSKVAL